MEGNFVARIQLAGQDKVAGGDVFCGCERATALAAEPETMEEAHADLSALPDLREETQALPARTAGRVDGSVSGAGFWVLLLRPVSLKIGPAGSVLGQGVFS